MKNCEKCKKDFEECDITDGICKTCLSVNNTERVITNNKIPSALKDIDSKSKKNKEYQNFSPGLGKL